MTKAFVAVSAIAIVLLIVSFLVLKKTSMTHFAINVAFPFSVLKRSPDLLDPLNTESTWEYYLLENLSLGLLRDDLNDPSGFAPGLAAAWSQPSPNVWSFEIAKDLRWSDGSSITVEELLKFYRGFQKHPARHSFYLKTLEGVLFNEKNNSLDFIFRGPVGRGVLHEFSLADSGLVHPKGDWKITSGPYYVKAYDPEGMYLDISQNRHSQIPFVAKSPRDVRLYWRADGDFTRMFIDDRADIFSSAAFTFRSKVRRVAEIAGKNVVRDMTERCG